MSKQHTLIPTVCGDCWASFQQRVEASPTQEPTNAVCWCPHAHVLAVATVNAGAITRTIVQGPLSAAEATSMLHGLAAMLPEQATIQGMH